MPGNIILINSAIEYYVGDSKMDELIIWLDRNGFREKEQEDEGYSITDPYVIDSGTDYQEGNICAK